MKRVLPSGHATDSPFVAVSAFHRLSIVSSSDAMLLSALTATQWATILAAAFAGIAASAAAVSTLLQYQVQLKSMEPWVQGHLFLNLAGEPELHLDNFGAGGALLLRYFVVDAERGLRDQGNAGRGALAPGERTKGKLEFPPPPAGSNPFQTGEAYAMWWCEDARRRTHFWTSEGDYRRYPRRRWWQARRERSPADATTVFESFFPEVDVPTGPPLTSAPRRVRAR
jgi:hypothetical protein